MSNLDDSVLATPPSVARTASFLDEVTRSTAFQSLPENPAFGAIGMAGRGAQGMADEVMGRASFGGLLPVTRDRNALADKYSIQSRDVREFAQWLVKVRDTQADEQNVVQVQVIERTVPGPERVVQGPPRDLTQAELDALIARSSKPQAATPIQTPEPSQRKPEASKEPEYKGPTTGETREAVGFLNRGVWGSNLGFGGFMAGMTLATPSLGGGAPPLTYMMQGFGAHPAAMGGMAAYHGMPGGMLGSSFGPGPLFMPAAGGLGSTSLAGASVVGAAGGSPGLLPMVFDTAPGPMGMGVSRAVPTVGDVLLNSRLTPTPQLGQMTLVAPPLHVASPEAELAGTAVAFQWSDLGRGASAVDTGGLGLLRNVVPEGTSFIFPALSPTDLPPGAVNLNLTPSLSRQLLAAGYGVDNPSVALQSSVMAQASSGIPPAAALAGSIVPIGAPRIASAGILGGNSNPDLLGEAGAGYARSGGALDFLGLPVRLAPSIGGSSEARYERDIRASAMDPGRPSVIRPGDFGSLRNSLFSTIHSVDAEPDQAAWRKAAPVFGLRNTDPETLLSPDARVNLPNPGAPMPQIEGSSDRLSRSMGLAAQASDTLQKSHAARPSDMPFGPSTTPGTTSSHSFSPAASHLPSGELPFNLPASSPRFGGTAMSNFLPTTGGTVHSIGRPAHFGAPTVSLPNLGGAPSFATTSHGPAVSSATPSAPTSPSKRSAAAPQTSTTPRALSRSTPAHLPMLGALQPTMIANSGITSSPARPSMMSAIPSWNPLQSSATPFTSHSSPAVSSALSPVSRQTAHQPTFGRSVPTQAGAPAIPSAPSFNQEFSTPSFGPTATNATTSHAAPRIPDLAVHNRNGQDVRPLHQPPQITATSFVMPSYDMPLRTPPEPMYAPPGGIQASDERVSTPAQESRDARAETTHSSEIGGAAEDVNVLAQEVWSLLKQRMTHEADRSGLR